MKFCMLSSDPYHSPSGNDDGGVCQQGAQRLHQRGGFWVCGNWPHE